MSRAAAKHTTVVSLFRINVRPSVQHKCHLVRLPWYQMLTSWAQPEVVALAVATGTVGRRPWESYAPACSGADDAVASCRLPLRR